MTLTDWSRGQTLRADDLDAAFAQCVDRNGDQMVGLLRLAGDPINPLDAATKEYVDNRFVTTVIPIDTSNTFVTATGTSTARTLATRFGDVFNLKDYASNVGVGNAAQDTAAFTAAIAYATAHPGTTIFIPGGTYNFTPPASPGGTNPVSGFHIPTQTTIQGAGQQKTIIMWNDTLGFNLFASAGYNATNMVNDIVLCDFTITGSWLANGNAPTGGFPILINWVNGLSFFRITSEYSRIMAMVSRGSIDVHAENCTIRYAGRDGINFGQCANVSVLDNIIEHTDDDGIAVASNNIDIWGVRKNITVVGNRLFDSQGIKIISARQCVVNGNTLDCVKANGITIFTSLAANQAGTVEGMSAAQSVVISNNSVTNIIKRDNIDNLSQNAVAIQINGSSARAGTYAAIPGENNTGAGTVVDPYPEFKANSSSTTVPTYGSYGIVITGNFIGRTLPACNGTDPRYNHFADFGFGQLFFRSGWQNPALAEDDYRDIAINIVNGVVRDVLISGNTFRGMVTALALTSAVRLENIVFRGNNIIDCRDNGVVINSSGITRCYVEDNLFDLDPFHKHSNRGPNGTWLANGSPSAIQSQLGSGMIIRGNVFKNCCRDSSSSSQAPVAGWLWENNFVEADPVTTGFSVSNKGVGTIQRAAGTRLIQCDSDPASATFGTILNANQNVQLAMPTTGKWLVGEFVRNCQTGAVSQPVIGWNRITTGNGNVLGTDWQAIYASAVAPQTGWGTSSNGVRGAINGSTATLPQTAAALAQLIIDLTARGFIGT